MQSRKIFFTVASGGHDTDLHYHATIRTPRTIDEIRSYIDEQTAKQLNSYLHDRPYAVWGAVPGTGNLRTWGVMEQGDYVMVYKSGHIIAAAEVALKVRNPALARYFWREDENGQTWELIYFLTNLTEVNVKKEVLNSYLGYSENYFPRGFMAIDQQKADNALSAYGDLLSLLQKLEKGEKVEKKKVDKEFEDIVEEKIERATTEHDEMQWRLIRLGNRAKLDVWVPPNDQGKKYNGETFRDHVIKEFRETLDVPSYIKNIDTVWKLGLSIKAAFEIENSTAIYSGILRLSDLRALAPNSNYPLLIVADRSKRNRVFDQLRRPSFSNEYLQLDRAVKFLSYDSIRELDSLTTAPLLDVNNVISKAERLPD